MPVASKELVVGSTLPATTMPSLAFGHRLLDVTAARAFVFDRAHLSQALHPCQAFVDAAAARHCKAYGDFIAAYPDDPMAKRVRAIIAAHREAITWERTCAEDTARLVVVSEPRPCHSFE
jgi:hypothetical protein